MEEWKECIECSLYSVSSLGNVKSRDHILKPWIQNGGYEMVCFCVNYIKKKYTVHSLVASAFIGKRPDNYVIDHIDDNRRNNKLNNLQYITQSANLRKSKGKGTNSGYKHINLTDAGNYKIQIHRPSIIFVKTVKTLSEAILIRDEFIKLSD